MLPKAGVSEQHAGSESVVLFPQMVIFFYIGAIDRGASLLPRTVHKLGSNDCAEDEWEKGLKRFLYYLSRALKYVVLQERSEFS